MEEYTENITQETTSFDEYIENTEENTPENTDGNGMSDTGQTGENEDIVTGDSDNNDSFENPDSLTDTNTDAVSDTENNISGIPSSDTESGTDSDTTADNTATDTELLERVENLLDAIAPVDPETGERLTADTAEPELSEHDMQMLETLQNIDTTLSAMYTENELLHTETLKYREEMQKTQQNFTACLEINIMLLAAIGFFIALMCGGKFADIFFRRMKGDGGSVG